MAQTNRKRPRNIKHTLKQIAVYLGYHKIAIAVVAILVIISGTASIAGTYLLKPIINNYILPGNIGGLVRMIAVLGIIYICGVLATYGYSQLMVVTAQKIVKEIRSDLFSKVQSLPVPFLDSQTHGELMSRFTNDIDTVAEALNNSFAMAIQNFVMVIGTVIMLLVLNLQLSLIVISSLTLMFLFIRYSSKKSKYYFSKQQKYLGELNGFIEEMVEGQKVVKVFNHEEQDLQEFERRNQKLKNAGIEAFKYAGSLVPTVVTLSYVNYAITACIGGLFTISGLMSIGGLASYLVYVRQTALPIHQFSQQMNFILNAISGAERIFEIMDKDPEIDDGDVTLVEVKKSADGSLVEASNTKQWAWKSIENGKQTLTLLQGDVRFYDVEFGYNKDHQILKKLNLYAKPGQKIAFVGSTGAGKTTITNLINRFYDIDKGLITYDGIDIQRIKKADLRKTLSVVLQDTHLFTGTIADNIRYGRLDAAKDEVIAAAKLANADPFIRRLPEGYDTVLTGDGSNLSQGQRQLLAIARAAVSNPPVLILDEATSSIDTHTERLIEKGMDRLMEGKTVFVIAHRLSTVRNAKAIIVLHNGEILERGSHEELLAQKGSYYQLYTGMFELT